MTDTTIDSLPATRRKTALTVVVWGTATFVATFGVFWLLDTSRSTFTLAALLFPNTDVEVRYHYITAMLLTVPPLAFAIIAGCIHKSLAISVGIALVYALPIGAFFALVVPAWH